MATLAQTFAGDQRPDLLSGTPRAGFIDRWIYVFTAASFVVITFTGFIPDSLMKIAAVQAGGPPFPLVLHMHAVLMGSFLLLLLVQTTLMATGKCALHRRVGIAAFVVAPAIVLVGFVLVPTMYHQTWNAAQAAPPGATRDNLQQIVLIRDNIMLLQLRIGFLFPLFLLIGLRARGINAGLHKRMMILATAMALPAAIDRITWLPTTLPASPLATDLYTLLAVSPMFVWDVIRNRRIHEAYLIWLAVNLPFAIAVQGLWGTEWWHSMAPRLMGV